jgi:hypothetical protein
LSRAIDELALLLDNRQRLPDDMLDDLWVAWRAACLDQAEAFHDWCAGERTYDAVVAALDREEAAAAALADVHATLPTGSAVREAQPRTVKAIRRELPGA